MIESPLANKRHVVPLTHQLFGQIGDDAFGPAIQARRHAFDQWGNLSNSHGNSDPPAGYSYLNRAAAAKFRRVHERAAGDVLTIE